MSGSLSDNEMVERPSTSSLVYPGRLIQVRVDSVLLPDESTARREVVDHPGAVAIVALLQDETVLLLRQYRHAAKQVLWEIPAGTREAGEIPARCAARELEEETGYQAGKLEKLYEIFVAPGYCTEVVHGFYATQLTSGGARTEHDELLRVEAVPFARALELIASGQIIDAKTLCGLLMVARLLGR